MCFLWWFMRDVVVTACFVARSDFNWRVKLKPVRAIYCFFWHIFILNWFYIILCWNWPKWYSGIIFDITWKCICTFLSLIVPFSFVFWIFSQVFTIRMYVMNCRINWILFKMFSKFMQKQLNFVKSNTSVIPYTEVLHSTTLYFL